VTKSGHCIEGILRDESPYGAELLIIVDGVPDAPGATRHA